MEKKEIIENLIVIETSSKTILRILEKNEANENATQGILQNYISLVRSEIDAIEKCLQESQE